MRSIRKSPSLRKSRSLRKSLRKSRNYRKARKSLRKPRKALRRNSRKGLRKYRKSGRYNRKLRGGSKRKAGSKYNGVTNNSNENEFGKLADRGITIQPSLLRRNIQRVLVLMAELKAELNNFKIFNIAHARENVKKPDPEQLDKLCAHITSETDKQKCKNKMGELYTILYEEGEINGDQDIEDYLKKKFFVVKIMGKGNLPKSVSAELPGNYRKMDKFNDVDEKSNPLLKEIFLKNEEKKVTDYEILVKSINDSIVEIISTIDKSKGANPVLIVWDGDKYQPDPPLQSDKEEDDPPSPFTMLIKELLDKKGKKYFFGIFGAPDGKYIKKSRLDNWNNVITDKKRVFVFTDMTWNNPYNITTRISNMIVDYGNNKNSFSITGIKDNECEISTDGTVRRTELWDAEDKPGHRPAMNKHGGGKTYVQLIETYGGDENGFYVPGVTDQNIHQISERFVIGTGKLQLDKLKTSFKTNVSNDNGLTILKKVEKF